MYMYHTPTKYPRYWSTKLQKHPVSHFNTPYYMHINSQASIFQAYLYKFLGQFERRALKTKVVAWRAGQNETKVDMDEVTFTVDQDVSIVSDLGKQCSIKLLQTLLCGGGLAQMVERSLSMREVPGSIPGSSNLFI